MRSAIGRLRTSERGATAVEYGFILALVVIVIVAALSSLAGTTIEMWSNVSDKVTTAR